MINIIIIIIWKMISHFLMIMITLMIMIITSLMGIKPYNLYAAINHLVHQKPFSLYSTNEL